MTGLDRVADGRHKGLDATSTRDNHFAILAIDHIASMAETMRPDDPSVITAAQLTEAKVEIARQLRHLASALLLDPHLTAVNGPGRTDLATGTGLVLGIEDGDYVTMETAPRLADGWSVQRASENGADAIKVAFYFDPEGDTRAVEKFVRDVARECERHGLPLFAEPLGVVRDPADRSNVIIESARRASQLGVDVLKLEFPADVSLVSSEEAWEEACVSLDEASLVPWTLLSAGEEFDRFSQMLRVACESGASGFVVGRSVWREAVRGGRIGSTWAPTATARLEQLARITRQMGRPWTERVASSADIDGVDGKGE